jgi:pimeloyl-ACP methyl ester carboxylesterase/DNA-binding CsgD family transcriptional regulator
LVKPANWLTHLEFDWNSPVWRHWLTELSRTHTLVRYDVRGTGLSDWNIANFSFDAWVRDLETVVNATGLKRFPLLGISQGGAVAIAYAARHPEKVSHIIIYGGYARGRLKRDLTPQQVAETETLLQLTKVGWGKDNPAFRQVFTTLFIPEGTVEQTRWFNDLQRISTSPENAVQHRLTIHAIDVTDLAARVTVPTLVLHAREDAIVPFEEGRLLAALIPGARFVPLESKNHVLLEDEPAWPRFLAEVRRFLGVPASGLDTAPFPGLTERERDVLELIAQGCNNAEIAERLVISPKTVRNHITNVFDKLQVTDRAQAIVRARDAGLGQSSMERRVSLSS